MKRYVHRFRRDPISVKRKLIDVLRRKSDALMSQIDSQQ